MIVYLDTSAALKILIAEHGTRAMREAFGSWQSEGHDIVSSYLLMTELHCAARRRGFADQQVIDTLLSGIELVDVDRSHLQAAARTSHGLRSADAVHLVTALSVEADLLVTYDHELAAAAQLETLEPLSPGAGPEARPPAPRR